MLSVGSKTPQLSTELSTSDEYTPESIIQLQEVIGLNVSVTLPEVSATVPVLMWSKCMLSHDNVVHTLGIDLFTDCRTQSGWDVVSQLHSQCHTRRNSIRR